MDINDEITIEFSEEQKTEIISKCGFVPKPIVTNSLSLIMLSLAATAKSSDVLPLVNRISTSHKILESHENNLSNQVPYTLTLELSDEQREIIREVVNKDWHRVVITPDDYDINFKEIWENEVFIQHIGKSFVIISDGVKYSPSIDEIIIKLPIVNENNNTFGTGSHPTTQIILSLLEKYLKPNAKVLDIGTGSGLLAVGAAKLGAEKIFAIDIDSNAVETAKITAKLNNVYDKIEIKTGSIDVIEETYDLVTANLFAKIIISIADSLADKIAPSGILLVSGVVSARMPEIIRVMQETGFVYLESITIDIWNGIAFQRKNLAKP